MNVESGPRVAAAMGAGAVRWGGAPTLAAALIAGVFAAVSDGPSTAAAVVAVLLGGALAVGALALGPRLLAAAGRVAEPGVLLVVALAVYVFVVTVSAGIAAWLLRWGALPGGALGLGVLAGTLGATVGVVRGFVRTRVVTFGEANGDVGHTDCAPPQGE